METILLVGCGKMGGAMLRGCLGRGTRADDVVVVEPSQAALADLAVQGVRLFADASELPAALSPSVHGSMRLKRNRPLPARRALPRTPFASLAAGMSGQACRRHPPQLRAR